MKNSPRFPNTKQQSNPAATKHQSNTTVNTKQQQNKTHNHFTSRRPRNQQKKPKLCAKFFLQVKAHYCIKLVVVLEFSRVQRRFSGIVFFVTYT